MASDDLSELLKRYPQDTKEIVENLWRVLPADVRRDALQIAKLLEGLATRGTPAALLPAFYRMVEPLMATDCRVVVVGPVNVGKSTLYNALNPTPEPKAEVSPIPGTTRQVQSADVHLFHLVDTPGADRGDEAEKTQALEAAKSADFLLIVFDVSRGVNEAEQALYRDLKALGKRHLVVLNKIDLIEKKHRHAVVATAASALGLSPDDVHPVSAQKDEGVQPLVLEVAAADPRLLGELGRVVVPMRRQLGWQVVRRATMTSIAVALSPLPLPDLLPLTIIQTSMVLSLARIYAQKMTLQRSAEVCTTFGVGAAARGVFEMLVKLGGPPAWILSAGIAGSTTLSIGFATMRWFETQHAPTREEMRRWRRELEKKLVEWLKSRFGKKKPQQQTLEQALDEALDGLVEPGNLP